MKNVIGLITCNYSAKTPGVLADERPIASMPYLGRYRLVDFALSNMVNCGIRTIGMVMPFNYRSIIDHVGSGKDWDLDRKNGGLFILPGSAFGTSRTGSRFLLRDLEQHKVYFTRSTSTHVILSSANFVYNFDYDLLYAAHKESGADVTVLTQIARADDEDVVRFDVADGRVTGLHHGVKAGETAFLDCFIIAREKLLELLDMYATVDYLDLFEAMADDLGNINVNTYYFDGYAAPVFKKETYYASNMDLLNPEVMGELFPPHRFIKTKAHDTSPAKHEIGSKVANSLVSAGDRIYGEVTGSVLGRNVVVENGAAVRDSIVMQGCIIKSGARVEHAIVDRNNIVPEGTEICGTPEDVFVQPKGRD